MQTCTAKTASSNLLQIFTLSALPEAMQLSSELKQTVLKIFHTAFQYTLMYSKLSPDIRTMSGCV